MIPAFITVRTRSTRLPEKCLLPFGEGSVLEHVIRRAVRSGLYPVVCTTSDVSDDRVEEIAARESVKCFRGSTLNKLKRWLDCCERFGIRRFHTVDADDPFFDGALVKKSFRMLDDGYDVVYPTESSKNGGASVGFSLTKDVVERACTLAGPEDDTEMMWYYIEKVPGVRTVALPEASGESVVARLTLDYEEDYWLLCTVQRLLGSFASRAEIDGLLRRNPDLYRINWFRNDEWRKAQLARKV